ncbi:MGMT family protein [Shewanella jiangmenensis]
MRRQRVQMIAPDALPAAHKRSKAQGRLAHGADKIDSEAESESNKSLSPQRIWQIVTLIPAGKVLSYGKVADLAGLPGRARYVSRALKLAPDSLNLPWHRVINSQGKISFAVNTPAFREQQELLRLDGVQVNQGKIALSEYEWQPCLATLMLQLSF